MAQTKIEWTASQRPDGSSAPGYTFNPWIGCTHVSEGCRLCYAEEMMDKRYKRVPWGKGQPRQRTSMTNWKKPHRWNKEAASTNTRYKVFCASLADVFDPEAPQAWRNDLWKLISETVHLDWLLLTKRPQHIQEAVPELWTEAWPENVWLGVTVENQRAAEERIPLLLSFHAPVRFLSCEPLVEHVQLEKIPHANKIDWIICGGESGRGKHVRPMSPTWARALRDFSKAHEIPFFFKQWGAWYPSKDDETPSALSGTNVIDDTTMIRVGKKSAGRLLDGAMHEAIPQPR